MRPADPLLSWLERLLSTDDDDVRVSSVDDCLDGVLLTRALAKLDALKKQRESSPLPGLNPNAMDWRPPASVEQSAQQIGDAAFTALRGLFPGRRPLQQRL